MPNIIEYVNTLTGTSTSNNLLIYDLTQFQSNANTVYPAGTTIYYKSGTGQITGVHKISDGVTPLNALPMLVDDYYVLDDAYTSITMSRCPFDNELNNYNGTGYRFGTTTTRLGKSLANNLSLVNTTRGLFTPIWYPMYVYGIGMIISKVSIAGPIRMAIYQPNATYDSFTLLTGSATPNINIATTGYHIYTYSSPILLDVGSYGLTYTCPSTTSVTTKLIAGITGSLVMNNRIGVRYQPAMNVQTSFVMGYQISFPATINLTYSEGADHIWPIVLLNKPAI